MQLIAPATLERPHHELHVVVQVAETVVALVEHGVGDAKERWARNFLYATQLAAERRITGYDSTVMKLLPCAVPAKWGDVGPHFSLVSAPPKGNPTQAADGTVDDLAKAKQAARSLQGRIFTLPLDNPVNKFMLCSADNDEITNGPVQFSLTYGPEARAEVNRIRGLLGLGPFSDDHEIHQAICKVTHQTGHADMRASPLVLEWPMHRSNPGLCVPKQSLAGTAGSGLKRKFDPERGDQ